MAVDDFETVLYIPGGEYETVLSTALIN